MLSIIEMCPVLLCSRQIVLEEEPPTPVHTRRRVAKNMETMIKEVDGDDDHEEEASDGVGSSSSSDSDEDSPANSVDAKESKDIQPKRSARTLDFGRASRAAAGGTHSVEDRGTQIHSMIYSHIRKYRV